MQSCSAVIPTIPGCQNVVQLIESTCPVVVATKCDQALEIHTVSVCLMHFSEMRINRQVTVEELPSTCLGIPHGLGEYRVGYSVARALILCLQLLVKCLSYRGHFDRLSARIVVYHNYQWSDLNRVVHRKKRLAPSHRK